MPNTEEIILTPTWEALLPVMLENHTVPTIHHELRRMAWLADDYNNILKLLEEATGLLTEAASRVQDLRDDNPNAAEDLAAWSDDARDFLKKVEQ